MRSQWQSYPEKKRLQLVSALIAVSFLVAYFTSFKAAYQAHQLKSKLSSEYDSLKGFLDEKTIREKEIPAYAIQTLPLTEVQSLLLGNLEKVVAQTGLTIHHIPQYEISKEFGRDVLSLKAMVEGGFHDQVKLTSLMESNNSPVYLQSINLNAKFDRRNTKPRLIGTFEFKAVLQK